MSVPNIIAIDGPAASGKTTLGKALADELDYLFFDTGVGCRVIGLGRDLPEDRHPGGSRHHPSGRNC